MLMLSVGIDVSKEKSTVCGMRHLGEIVFGPFEIAHTESDLSELARMIVRLDDDTRVVMEATGIYHLPVEYSASSEPLCPLERATHSAW